MIAAGDVQLVINTPSGSGARADGALIRSACVVHAVACLTTISAGLRRREGHRGHAGPGAGESPHCRSCTDERPLDPRRHGGARFADTDRGRDVGLRRRTRRLRRPARARGHRREVIGVLRVGGQRRATRRVVGCAHGERGRFGRSRCRGVASDVLARISKPVARTWWPRSGDARSTEFADAAEAVRGADVVAVEVNASCPNLESRSTMFAHSALGDRGARPRVEGGRPSAVDQAQSQYSRPRRDRRRRTRGGRGRTGAREHRAGSRDRRRDATSVVRQRRWRRQRSGYLAGRAALPCSTVAPRSPTPRSWVSAA